MACAEFMKIHYITNSFSHTGGGLVGAVSGLVKRVQDLGHVVKISAYDNGEVTDAWRDMPLHKIKTRRIVGIHFFGGLSDSFSQMAPDLVHAHGLWLRSSAQNYNWCKRTGTQYIISPHGMLDPWAVQNSAWKKKIAGMWFEHAHLNNASCIHALCAAEADAIREYGQKNPICVIPNGIELPDNTESISEIVWKKDNGRKALLFIGRLHPKKGLPLLLDAWASLKKSKCHNLEEWFLAIAGWSEAGHREELEAQVSALEISEDVEFLGGLHGSKKAAALANASAFILPSYSEGLPMSILEAWSYRLPVLMTPQCNLPEGFSAKAAISMKANKESIEEVLSEFFGMLQEEQLLMGERGYDLVKKQFVWKNIAMKMLTVYKWILNDAEMPEYVRLD